MMQLQQSQSVNQNGYRAPGAVSLSVHRVGISNNLFAAGEDIASVMDALHWKPPRMALRYNRNLAGDNGAAGHLLFKMKWVASHLA